MLQSNFCRKEKHNLWQNVAYDIPNVYCRYNFIDLSDSAML